MNFQSRDFQGAIEVLANNAGMEIPSQANDKSYEKHKKIFEVNSQAAEFYSNNLINHADSKHIRDYLLKRGISEEVYKKLGVPKEDWVTSGYEWENSNWGCKWGGSEAELTEREEGMLGYTFSTPWGPPMGFMEKVIKDYPELCFELEYEEPGMAFAGKTEWSGGELTFEESWEMEEDSDWEE
mgnify:CR=1 FL=1